MMFCHGERSPYPYSMNRAVCFDNPALADKTCTELFHLVDMAVMDGDEIMQYR
ncbi:Rpn family recombination-promoting nuclease/putative transposase, partial [Escherichia coli]